MGGELEQGLHVPAEFPSMLLSETSLQGPFSGFELETLLDGVTKRRAQWACFWAVVSIVSLPALVITSVLTGSSDALVALAFIQLVSVWGMLPGVLTRSLHLYKLLRPYHLILSILCLVLVFGLATLISWMDSSFLNWSWLDLAAASDDDEAISGNTIAYAFKYLGTAVLFYGMLVCFLPLLALIEEVIFRRGSHSWRKTLLRSLIFGLIHVTAGASIGTSLLVLSVLGVVLAREYFDGLRASAWVHMVTVATREPQSETAQLVLARAKHHADRPWVMRSGFGERSWRAGAMVAWARPLDLSWQAVWNATTGEHEVAIEDLDTLPVDLWAGTTASTLLHMLYNILAVTIFLAQLLYHGYDN